MKALKPIIYYSIFDYPLTEDEIFHRSEIEDRIEFKKELNILVEKNIVQKKGIYFLFHNNETAILKRENGNKQAIDVMPKAKKRAVFISKFPFIKGVAISGSLSKGYFDNESDFDFFVITQSERVWITRFIMALYKRIFLNNSKKEFCVNYYISTSSLEIEEKNKFTATEIVTAIPISGKYFFKEFYKKNNWVATYYPHFNSEDRCLEINEVKKNNTVKCVEFLLNNIFGKGMNYLLMKIITIRWEKRYKNRERKNQYKSKNEIAKHHPTNFEEKVIDELNAKYVFCKTEYNIEIPKEYA